MLISSSTPKVMEKNHEHSFLIRNLLIIYQSHSMKTKFLMTSFLIEKSDMSYQLMKNVYRTNLDCLNYFLNMIVLVD